MYKWIADHGTQQLGVTIDLNDPTCVPLPHGTVDRLTALFRDRYAVADDKQVTAYCFILSVLLFYSICVFILFSQC